MHEHVTPTDERLTLTATRGDVEPRLTQPFAG